MKRYVLPVLCCMVALGSALIELPLGSAAPVAHEFLVQLPRGSQLRSVLEAEFETTALTNEIYLIQTEQPPIEVSAWLQQRAQAEEGVILIPEQSLTVLPFNKEEILAALGEKSEQLLVIPEQTQEVLKMQDLLRALGATENLSESAALTLFIPIAELSVSGRAESAPAASAFLCPILTAWANGADTRRVAFPMSEESMSLPCTSEKFVIVHTKTNSLSLDQTTGGASDPSMVEPKEKWAESDYFSPDNRGPQLSGEFLPLEKYSTLLNEAACPALPSQPCAPAQGPCIGQSLPTYSANRGGYFEPADHGHHPPYSLTPAALECTGTYKLAFRSSWGSALYNVLNFAGALGNPAQCETTEFPDDELVWFVPRVKLIDDYSYHVSSGPVSGRAYIGREVCDTRGIPDDVPCERIFTHSLPRFNTVGAVSEYLQLPLGLDGGTGSGSFQYTRLSSLVRPCTMGAQTGRSSATEPEEVWRCSPSSTSGSWVWEVRDEQTGDPLPISFNSGEKSRCKVSAAPQLIDWDGDGVPGCEFSSCTGGDTWDADPYIIESETALLNGTHLDFAACGLGGPGAWRTSSLAWLTSSTPSQESKTFLGIDAQTGSREGVPLETVYPTLFEADSKECMPPSFTAARFNTVLGNYALHSLSFNSNPQLKVKPLILYPKLDLSRTDQAERFFHDAELLVGGKLLATHELTPGSLKLATPRTERDGIFLIDRSHPDFPRKLQIIEQDSLTSYLLEFVSNPGLPCKERWYRSNSCGCVYETRLPSTYSSEINPVGIWAGWATVFGIYPFEIKDDSRDCYWYDPIDDGLSRFLGRKEPGAYYVKEAKQVLYGTGSVPSPKVFSFEFDWDHSQTLVNPKLDRVRLLETDEVLSLDYNRGHMEAVSDSLLQLKSIESSLPGIRGDAHFQYESHPFDLPVTSSRQYRYNHDLLKSLRVGSEHGNDGVEFIYREIVAPSLSRLGRYGTQAIKNLRGKTMVSYNHRRISSGSFQGYAYDNATLPGNQNYGLKWVQYLTGTPSSPDVIPGGLARLWITRPDLSKIYFDLYSNWIERMGEPECAQNLYRKILSAGSPSSEEYAIRCNGTRYSEARVAGSVGPAALRQNDANAYSFSDYEIASIDLGSNHRPLRVPIAKTVTGPRGTSRCEQLRGDGAPLQCTDQNGLVRRYQYPSNDSVQIHYPALDDRTDRLVRNNAGNLRELAVHEGSGEGANLSVRYEGDSFLTSSMNMNQNIITPYYNSLGALSEVMVQRSDGDRLTLSSSFSENDPLLTHEVHAQMHTGGSGAGQRVEKLRFRYEGDSSALQTISVETSDQAEFTAVNVVQRGTDMKPTLLRGTNGGIEFDYYTSGFPRGAVREIRLEGNDNSRIQFTYEPAGLKERKVLEEVLDQTGSAYTLECHEQVEYDQWGASRLAEGCGGNDRSAQVVQRNSLGLPTTTNFFVNGAPLTSAIAGYTNSKLTSLHAAHLGLRAQYWGAAPQYPSPYRGATVYQDATGETLSSVLFGELDWRNTPTSAELFKFGRAPDLLSWESDLFNLRSVRDAGGTEIQFSYPSSREALVTGATELHGFRWDFSGTGQLEFAENIQDRVTGSLSAAYRTVISSDGSSEEIDTITSCRNSFTRFSTQLGMLSNSCPNEPVQRYQVSYDPFGNISQFSFEGEQLEQRFSTPFGLPLSLSGPQIESRWSYFYEQDGNIGVMDPLGGVYRHQTQVQPGRLSINLNQPGKESFILHDFQSRTGTLSLAVTDEKGQISSFQQEKRYRRGLLEGVDETLYAPQTAVQTHSSFNVLRDQYGRWSGINSNSFIREQSGACERSSQRDYYRRIAIEGTQEKQILTYPTGVQVEYAFGLLDGRPERVTVYRAGAAPQVVEEREYIGTRLYRITFPAAGVVSHFFYQDSRFPQIATKLEVKRDKDIIFTQQLQLDGYGRVVQDNNSYELLGAQSSYQHSLFFNPYGLDGLLGTWSSSVSSKPHDIYEWRYQSGPAGEARGPIVDGDVCHYNALYQCENGYYYNPDRSINAQLFGAERGIFEWWPNGILSLYRGSEGEFQFQPQPMGVSSIERLGPQQFGRKMREFSTLFGAALEVSVRHFRGRPSSDHSSSGRGCD